MLTILLLNGPNLDRLGSRQPDVYGAETLADVEAAATARAGELGAELICRQSNHEGQLIDWVHEAAENNWPVIINAGGFTHTSVALRDALAELTDSVGFIEVHISNVHAREEFRHHSLISPIADGIIVGLGTFGYIAAVEATVHRLAEKN